MRKLLSLLGVLSISASSSLMSISCNKDEINKSFEVNSQLPIIDGENWNAPSKENKYENYFHVDAPDKKGMLNDMQGAFFDGTYWHLYYLYNSEAEYDSSGEQIGKNGTEWYHMQTKDFINWEYKGIAVHKWNSKGWGDAAGGTLYVDKDKDFGKVAGGKVAISTAYGGEKGQNIMAYYSTPGDGNGNDNDFGYNFKELNKGNPILENGKELGTYPDFRDPHFFKKNGKFILYVSELDGFGVYVSDNPLEGYEKKGEYKAKHAMVECANIFELNVNGNEKEKKYVVIYGGNGNNDNGQPDFIDNLGTGTYYSVGHLDDNFVFQEEQAPKRLDFGADFYAAKFFEDTQDQSLPIGDHLIGTGWMSSWDYNRVVPNTGYWGNMSLARKIKLTKNKDGEYGMSQSFIGLDNQELTASGNQNNIINSKIRGGSYKLDLNFKNTKKSNAVIELESSDETYKNIIKLDFEKNKISTKRYTKDVTLVNNKGFIQDRSYVTNLNDKNDSSLSLIVDKSTIEAVLPDGSIISMVKFPDGVSPEKLLLNLSKNIEFDYKYYQFKKE
ncbi:levanase [Spiroplasma corruscae]|uniref:Levanase n=1 Tax=Spiroplasma corruscae TaxID=216934 RepID=A0A222EQA8_9MOLU|nr:glycoside hydrolase family 32 protein [Spiroplasma corruscae]ASP28551.1 levanase [Spiroplasma corruscae]